MFTIVFYALALGALAVSFFTDRARTRQALVKAWKAFSGILPEFIVVIIVAGIILAFLDPQTISRILGRESGWAGVLAASVVGSVTLIPGFIAFPLAALLIDQGAGILQIGAFVSSLMMVGVVTFPMERGVFGTRVALTRNILAFGFSLLVALVLRIVLGGSL